MLHKTGKMTGFHILATDGEAGHVDDFLVDESWAIRGTADIELIETLPPVIM